MSIETPSCVIHTPTSDLHNHKFIWQHMNFMKITVCWSPTMSECNMDTENNLSPAHLPTISFESSSHSQVNPCKHPLMHASPVQYSTMFWWILHLASIYTFRQWTRCWTEVFCSQIQRDSILITNLIECNWLSESSPPHLK